MCNIKYIHICNVISKYNIHTCILLATYSVPDALYLYMFDPPCYPVRQLVSLALTNEAICLRC